MPARLHSAFMVLLFVVAACDAPAAGGGQPGTTTPTIPTATASAVPTRAATPEPSTAHVDVFPNPDGSVVVGLPGVFGFAQPGDGGIWGILEHPGVGRDVIRLDPETYEFETIVQALPILPDPIAPVAVNGSIWLVDDVGGSVTQYDAETGTRIREIAVGRLPIEPVAAFGDAWTINHHGDSVTRIDSETGEAWSIDLPGSRPLTITVVADDLLLVNGPQGSPTTGCFKQYGQIGTAIDGQVWRRYCDTDEVTIADPRTGEILDSFRSPACPYPPLYVDGNMWLPSGPEPCSDMTRGLVALDPETHAVVATYELPADVRAGGWWFAAFDSWWYVHRDGLVRVPADTLRNGIEG